MEITPNPAFDFSLDAADFKKKLGQQLRSMKILELDDDDLDLINAAGPSHMETPEEKKERF